MFEKKSKKTISFLNLFLLIISALFFSFSHPNAIINNGFFLTGFLIYLPVLCLVHNNSIKKVWLIGGIYGLISYGLYAFWLVKFNPFGLFLACAGYFLILAIVFLFLKLIDILFKKNAWLVQTLFLSVYEYIKTLGFLGFSYGVSAYTQWYNTLFIQICDVIGVFGLNFFIIFPSAWIYSFFEKGHERKIILNSVNIDYSKNNSNLSEYVKREKVIKNTERKSMLVFAFLWILTVLFFNIYGYRDIKSKKVYETVKVAAIQNNENPWKNGIDEYAKNIQDLKDLTNEALEISSDIDFVVWSETSVVPSILYQYYGLIDSRRFNLVYSLLNYIENKDAVFVIGNSDEEIDEENKTKKRFNSVHVYLPSENVIPPDPDVYSKIHLVPLSEYFPYKKYFPHLYKLLFKGENHLWEKGSEYKVFDYKGLKFSTPVCFEDTFGNDCRKFVQNGARCFFNLSNDGWSKSRACQYQHLSMSVFRSVENRVPTVRSTATGETCIINQNGQITAITPDFCKSYVVGNVDILDSDFNPSFYTLHGDLFGQLQVLLLLIILIIQILIVIIKSIKTKK